MNKKSLLLVWVFCTSPLHMPSSHLHVAEAAEGRRNVWLATIIGRTHHLLCASTKRFLHLSPAHAITLHSHCRILENSSFPLCRSRLHVAAGGSTHCASRRLWFSTASKVCDDAQGKPAASLNVLHVDPSHSLILNNICKILENPSYSSCLSQHLQPFANDISPALIAGVVQQQRTVPQATQFFQWASHVVRPDEYAYHSLLIKLGEFREFADMEKLVQDMKCQGYCISSTTLSIIIKAYGSADMPHEAMGVFTRAHEFNVALDCHMYTTLLSVLFKAKLIDDARSIYLQMLKSTCTLDSSAWATIIRGFGKSGCAKEAEACWDHMLNSGLRPNVGHYNALIEGLCESKLMNKALFTLMAMQEQSCKPNVYSFNPILGALCKLHRVPEALNIFSGMTEFCAPNQATCNILLEGLFFNEHVSSACELFEKMEQEGMVDTRSYALLSAGLRKAKQTDKLLSICQNLHVKKDGSVDDVISNALLQCLCKGQNVNEAMTFFNGLKNPNVASYAMMINSLCKVWKLNEAMMLLVDMIDKGCKPNAYCYAPLMAGILKSGRLDDGVNLFNEMVRRGIETNDVTCGFLLRKLSEAQRADDVLRVCKHVVDNSIVLSGSVWDLSMECLESAGRADAANSLHRSLKGQGCIGKQVLKASI